MTSRHAISRTSVDELGSQRTCACGVVGPIGECEACRKKRLSRETGFAHELGKNETAQLPGENNGCRRLPAYDFARIRISPGSLPQTSDSTGWASASTRNPNGQESAEVITANGDSQGATPDFTQAPGGSPVTPPPPKSTPTGTANKCSVSSHPSYRPTGTIPVTVEDLRKKASFSLAAAFDTDAATGKKPSCCEVRQFIKWDSAYHKWSKGPPNGKFPKSAKPDTWYEDRDHNDKRYGHRAGPHSDPGTSCSDEYKNRFAQDQANGNTYCGRDTVAGPSTMTGQLQFQLDVIDTCNGNETKASSSVITIDWTPKTRAPAPGVAPPSPPPPSTPLGTAGGART
jgi:hypothetical protein